MPTTTATRSELDILQDLNRDYIRSVQHSDVRRFDEILADDFLCSNPDGSLIDRAAFLKQTAVPVAISNLEARDVVVRIMGDVAIIHARTTYTRPDGKRAPAGTRTCGPVAGGAGSPCPLTSRAAEASPARAGRAITLRILPVSHGDLIP
jgi:ketosteroid isomerase-like protein